MARGDERTSDLYIRLGLSYDELESGFVDAERTIRDNMTRLSRENQIIDLQTRVSISGLDETADAEQILQIRMQALNRQLEHQRDRVRLAAAELENMRDRTGENSDQTQRAMLALERERLALTQLERQLENLNDSQVDTGDSTDGLRERFDALTERCAPVVAGLTAIVGGLIAAGNATKELVEDWRELQQQAYELNMPVKDTENFLRHMRLAGGKISDFEGYIRGISDAWVKGEWDDPEFIALRKYGAQITDATGRLKNFKAFTEEVYQAYLKAKTAGEEIEFLQLTGGEAGVRDTIQYFERYAEAKEDASRIFNAGLNSNEMHAVERSLNLLTEQMNEFGDAATNVITPATKTSMDKLFEMIHDGTKVLSENKLEIQSWGFVIAEATKKVAFLLNPLGEFKRMLEGLADSLPKVDLDKAVVGDIDEINKTPLDALKDYLADVIKSSDLVERAREAQIEYNNSVKGAAVSWADFRREQEKSKDNDPLSQYAFQRIKAFKDELEDIRAEIANFNNDYKQSLAELEIWRKRELTDKLHVSDEERSVLEELYTAKLAQIEQKRAQAIKEIREDVEAELGTDLDQQLLDFQRQKKDWISAGIEKAEAEVLAERLKLDAIETANDEAVAALGAIYQTSLEQRLAQIEKEKQAWIDKGVEEVKATQWAEQAKVDAQRNAAMSVLKSQIEEYRSFSEGGYEGLMKHRRDELFKSGISPEDLQMTPQQLEAFQKAQDTVERNLLPNFATAYDRAEDRRLRDNQYVDEQRKTAAALDKFLAHQQGERLYDTLDNNDVRRLLSMPVMDKSALPSAETLDAMYQPINKTAEEFQTLIPQIEGAKETLEGFSAVEQPATASIPAPETPELDTSALNQPVADVTEMLTAMSSALDDVTGKITDLGTIIGEAIESIPQIDTVVETPDLTVDTSQLFSAFKELVSPMIEVNAQFREMAGKLLEVPSGLSELVGALNNLKAQPQAQQQQQVVTPPPNITVTVQIEEAHAWDSQHIQELADKVADRIEPELVNAIGGDSNRY